MSGATHTGKTTMLNALMSAARNDDRVVTVEETFELDLDVRDLVVDAVPPAEPRGHG